MSASNGDRYLVFISPSAKQMPDNEVFQLEVRVYSREDLSGVSLTVDAAMPQHGHGMNRVPRVSRLEPGHFLVEGMYFHMTGKWELYLDITHGALTERAQVVVELADE
ncbi:MAG: FixH family protein [Planctomycetota bacterium]|nr:FixH family protein [Planctomycetota bacterium]